MVYRKINARNRRQRRKAELSPKKATLLFIVALLVIGTFTMMRPGSNVEAVVNNQAKISALEKEVQTYSARAKELSEQSDTLSNAIAALQNERNQIQAEIDLNNAKVASLNAQITENEAKIKTQGAALSKTMANMYYDKQISSIEMLASSSNLSDYVDKEAQQSAVQSELNTSIKKINELKKELQTQKTEVERILSDQQGRRSELVAKQNQQQKLLNDTQGQEASYQQLMKTNNAEIARLQAEQAAANRTGTGGGTIVAGDPSHGGYPSYLYNARKDSLVDPWGMYNRECVSYTAWKVYQTYGRMPYWGGHGNANQWDDNARAAGIPTGSTPKAGAVAVWHTGRYGHVAWVESVNSNGTFNLSEMNRNSDGQYYERTGVSSSGVVFIYFGER